MTEHVRQFVLQSGNDFKYCWLTDSLDLKVGDRITLEDIPDRWWTVVEAYFTVKELEHVRCKEKPKPDPEYYSLDWIPM